MAMPTRVPMAFSQNIYLLKEYLKTLIAREVIFPGIPPRRWGNEFSQSELDSIYSGLQFIINQAHPLKDFVLIEAFGQIDESVALHWFLCDHWQKIVALLMEYPKLTDDYQASLN